VKEDRRFWSNRVEERKTQIIKEIRAWLEGIPLNGSLPAPPVVREHLAREMVAMFVDIWRELRSRFDQFAYSIREEIERVLMRGRADATPLEGMQFVAPRVAEMMPPPALDLPEAWLGLFGGGYLAILLGGPWSWALAAGGWLLGKLIGREGRRRRDVERLCKQVETRVGEGVSHLLPQVDEKVTLFRRSLLDEIDHRLDGLARDLDREVSQLGRPLAPGDSLQLEKIGTRLIELLRDTDNLALELSIITG
jgi:hypothetical protein